MKRSMMILLVLVGVTLTAGAAVAQDTAEEQRAIRSRIEERFDVVPLTDGIALTPKTRGTPVRLIELINGVISINGTVVTGRELRDRIGDDAEVVARLSYLRPEQQRSLFARAGSASQSRTGRDDQSTLLRARRSSGQRVRIFGDVTIQKDEQISEQAVAVFGSVRVDGEVGQEVVAVLGSVNLGPTAVVHGDVVSVGGRVRRDAGAQVRGSVTEVSLGDAGMHIDGSWIGPVNVSGVGFGAVPRLLGSTFRLFLLALFGGIALVIARGSVEGSAQRVSDNVPKAILVGLVAEVLVVPVFVLTAILLAVSIIGIPLLLLLPFAVLLLLLMAVAGFSGTAYAVGQGARRRFGMGGQAAFLDVCLGLAVILSPLLLGRMIALADWPDNPLAWLLIALGTGIEFFAWTAGFGAVLTNVFSGWRARRAAARGSTPVATA